MTREEIKVLLASVEAAFPAFFKNESRDAAKARINLWAVTFANEDAAAVNAALLEALKTSEYPPTIASLFKVLRARRAQNQPSTAQLWEDARRIAAKVSTNNYRARFGGYYGPEGKLTPQDLYKRNEDLFASLPECVRVWAGSPNGLEEQLDRPADELTAFVLPSFRRAVEAQQEQEIIALEALPAAERPALLGYNAPETA